MSNGQTCNSITLYPLQLQIVISCLWWNKTLKGTAMSLTVIVRTSVGNLITFHRGSKLTEPATLAPALPLGLRLSRGSHFGADYSWCYCTDVPLHWILSLGHPALKAIKFSASVNKSDGSASDHVASRVPKLIIGALQSKTEKALFFSTGVTFCSIKYVRRARECF